MKDLCNYIIPRYAYLWKEIGVGLGLASEVNIIEVDHHECRKRCYEMLRNWLQVEADKATWKKLLEILDSEAVYITQKDHG